MRQQHHSNVLPLHCSFVHQQNLWMVMPYVAGGSVLNLMKFAYSEVRHAHLFHIAYSHSTCSGRMHQCMMQGLEEPVIATILKEVLKGLDYMHRHGGIHRDVKVCCSCLMPGLKLSDMAIQESLQGQLQPKSLQSNCTLSLLPPKIKSHQ